MWLIGVWEVPRQVKCVLLDDWTTSRPTGISESPLSCTQDKSSRCGVVDASDFEWFVWINKGTSSGIHQGMPVVAGVKYIITKWYRERPWGIPAQAADTTPAS